MLYRTLARHERSMPQPLFLLLYDNLKGVWLDEGPRSLAGVVDLGGEEPDELGLVVGHNWYRARPGGRRGPAALAREEVLAAAAHPHSRRLRSRLRGRSEMPGETVRVTIEINGTVVGTPELGPEWSDARFVVPATTLRAGFNELSLEYATTPRERDRAHEGRDAAIAVDVLKMERRETRDGPV